MYRIRAYTFTGGFFHSTYVSFIHAAEWTSSLSLVLLHSIPLCENTTIYLSILLLIGIFFLYLVAFVISVQFSSVQSLSRVWLFATPWIAAHQASLSITISQSSLRLTSIESQGWSLSEWTGWISLQSKGPSRVFSNNTVQTHQFFSAQPSTQSNSHIHTWPQEKP